MKSGIFAGVLYLTSAAIAIAQGSSTQPAAVEQTLNSRSPVLIQAGSNLLLKGVTDDNDAIYQDGQTVYAQRLIPTHAATSLPKCRTTSWTSSGSARWR